MIPGTGQRVAAHKGLWGDYMYNMYVHALTSSASGLHRVQKGTQEVGQNSAIERPWWVKIGIRLLEGERERGRTEGGEREESRREERGREREG